MDWKNAIIAALRRYSNRHNTRVITRQGLINEELDQIVAETQSTAFSPEHILNRELQELRDAGMLWFTSWGQYFLLDTAINTDDEDLDNEILDAAINRDRLLIEDVPTGDAIVLARRRQGQDRLKTLNRVNYNNQCALCDIADLNLLVTSHIVRWADDKLNRGKLSNVICLCKFHDALFEQGYISLTDDFQILKRNPTNSAIIATILNETLEFRVPQSHPPSAEFLNRHRLRVGF